MNIISQMEESDINEVIDLWFINYLNYCNEQIIPNFFPNGKVYIENYLMKRIKNGEAIIIKVNNNISGYFTWIYFNFHNEKSAFCPIIGHCVKNEMEKENIYKELYNFVSEEWVKNDVFNHLLMIYYKDLILRDFSYNLGFGSYVGDVCKKVNTTMEEINCKFKITQATNVDCESLYKLVEESRRYYLSAPIFLKRDVIIQDDINKIIENKPIFLSWDNNKLIGFINMEINDKYDIENLSVPGSAIISPLGIYIRSEYRGKGIGKSFLNRIFHYCNENSIKYIHASFETSNITANKFWTKYFNPIVLSVRRTINKDVNM